MRGWCARARPRGDSAVCPLSREKGGGRRGKCVDTLQWATVKSREEGEGRRGECVDTLQWATVKSREKGEGRG